MKAATLILISKILIGIFIVFEGLNALSISLVQFNIINVIISIGLIPSLAFYNALNKRNIKHARTSSWGFFIVISIFATVFWIQFELMPYDSFGSVLLGSLISCSGIIIIGMLPYLIGLRGLKHFIKEQIQPTDSIELTSQPDISIKWPIISVSCILLVFCIISCYKYVKLHSEISSAQNTAKKFSSILNDVNSGMSISYEKIDKSKYGELAGLVKLTNDWAHDIQMDLEKLNQGPEDCNYSLISNPKVLFQSVLSSQCQFNFEKAEIILCQYEEIIKNRFDEYETRIRTSDLPERLKEKAISAFNKTKEENLKGSLNIIKTRKAYISEAKSFLDFMKENQTDWKFENDRFSFQSDKNADIFNSYIRNFRSLAKEEAFLREQVGAEFVQKQKELEQLTK